MPYLTTPAGRPIPWREGDPIGQAAEDEYRDERADYDGGGA